MGGFSVLSVFKWNCAGLLTCFNAYVTLIAGTPKEAEIYAVNQEIKGCILTYVHRYVKDIIIAAQIQVIKNSDILFINLLYMVIY